MQSLTADALLADLTTLGADLGRGDGETSSVDHHLASATTIRTLTRQHIGAFVAARPLVAAVLEGHKEIALHGARMLVHAGDLLVVPPNLECEIVNIPDPRTRRYRALGVEVDPDAAAALSRAHPSLCVSPVLGAFDPARVHVLRADPVSLQAVLHFARTLFAPGAHEAVLRHRLVDVLLSLSLQHAGALEPAAAVRTQARSDLVLAARNLIRGDPQAAWPAELVARRLAVSAPTLRRRLAAAGLTLRALRTEERMALAASLLARPGAQVAEVALRCGYRSPSKFARQFRRWSGARPARGRAR